MPRPKALSTAPGYVPAAERDRLEIIRFPSDDARVPLRGK
jgi:hypothetical protein